MNEPTSQSPHDAASEPVDDQGRLIDDVVCRRCGYNLRSLEADGVCPECGAAVAISIHGFYLRFAPLKWVRRLALGAKLLVASIATMVGWMAMMGFAIAMIVIAMPQNPSAVGPSPTLMMIMTVSMIGVWVGQDHGDCCLSRHVGALNRLRRLGGFHWLQGNVPVVSAGFTQADLFSPHLKTIALDSNEIWMLDFQLWNG